MNKLIKYSFLISILAVMGCKKDYTCACTYTFDWGDGTYSTDEYSFEILKSKKVDAETKCAEFQENETNWKYTYNCSITY